jgi:hypothetical protein
MTMYIKNSIISLLIALLLASASCGFESLLGRASGNDHPSPDGQEIIEAESGIISGKVPAASVADLDARDFSFITDDSDQLAPAVSIFAEDFSATFAAGEIYRGVIVVVKRGTVALRTVVPSVDPGQTAQAGDFDGIDNKETAQSILIEAKASSQGRSLSSYPALTLQAAMDEVNSLSAANVDVENFYQMVQAIMACQDCNRGSAARFRKGSVTASGLSIESALDPDFILANPIDYDGDGQTEDTTDDFDQALQAALDTFDFKACYCDEDDYYVQCGLDRPMITVAFFVDNNDGTKDGNCDTPIPWADEQPGASMFIAAGIHPDSPIQDNNIEQMLGAWIPNKVPMYDDGTHGDEKSGDGIWSLSFELPVGLKIGYKYTWGRQGDNWGGTEEWPGNRRLLEVVDVNGDHLILRYDVFGDETSNKDLANQLLPSNGGKGSIDWETDANSDGIADARERMYDSDGDCILDSWPTSSTITPQTTDCP